MAVASSTLLDEVEAIIQARQAGNDAQHAVRTAFGRSVSLVPLEELYRLRRELKGEVSTATNTRNRATFQRPS